MRPVVTVGTSLPDAYVSYPDVPNPFSCGCSDCSRPDRVALAVVVVAAFVLVMLLLLLFAAFIFWRYSALRCGCLDRYFFDAASIARTFAGYSSACFFTCATKPGCDLHTLPHTVHLAISCCSNKVAAKGLVGCGGGNVSIASFFNRVEPRVGCAPALLFFARGDEVPPAPVFLWCDFLCCVFCCW